MDVLVTWNVTSFDSVYDVFDDVLQPSSGYQGKNYFITSFDGVNKTLRHLGGV